jgi:hypothetical protein
MNMAITNFRDLITCTYQIRNQNNQSSRVITRSKLGRSAKGIQKGSKIANFTPTNTMSSQASTISYHDDDLAQNVWPEELYVPETPPELAYPLSQLSKPTLPLVLSYDQDSQEALSQKRKRDDEDHNSEEDLPEPDNVGKSPVKKIRTHEPPRGSPLPQVPRAESPRDSLRALSRAPPSQESEVLQVLRQVLLELRRVRRVVQSHQPRQARRAHRRVIRVQPKLVQVPQQPTTMTQEVSQERLLPPSLPGSTRCTECMKIKCTRCTRESARELMNRIDLIPSPEPLANRLKYLPNYCDPDNNAQPVPRYDLESESESSTGTYDGPTQLLP